jgi:hypothetical protein
MEDPFRSQRVGGLTAELSVQLCSIPVVVSITPY